MIITDKAKLEKFSEAHRTWQGIPAVEVTSGGYVYAAFYTGMRWEELGNYVVVYRAKAGEDFGEAMTAVYWGPHFRCYDQALWIDPLGRLWLTWAVEPNVGVYGVICDDPDAEEPQWSDVFYIGKGVMMNKPVVLSSGEWLFPIALWPENNANNCRLAAYESERKCFVYSSTDEGKSFTRLGGADAAHRCIDEHMILERRDGTLALYIRRQKGNNIAVCYSGDKGKTWSYGADSGIINPDSRFYIGRLKSGRVLLVNHDNGERRSGLTAYLSEDDGETWPYKLLLDERFEISYPDAKEADDGFIYIVYDKDRGCSPTPEQSAKFAREILLTRVTEDDILAGEIKNPGSESRRIISKLGAYTPA